ncbi:UDP-N-acetylmuramoyl-L-alanine--D-glutamate ligase [Parvularcula lutaonensis]|uniref:UDP-N-acetylmuramoyl-L-alanine--D-glutamate ligase n=1 Tax=Parvularcula lutaonensis TaxID=491923 RepID=A0ABV7MD38_9PROT|nr:UDP-N-acetylmuramoyl-L-alanine--D-glutamate ligase [Parvularcula lutaonensis]GGY38810.1 UDP-N-acetylmuramoylalanine--D-glutamate ligase [Parvularcula lutaonensis]
MKHLLHGTGTEGLAAAEYFRDVLQQELAVFDDHGGSIPGCESVDRTAAERIIRSGIYLRSPGIPPHHPLVQYAQSHALLSTTPTGFWLKNHAPSGTVTVTGTKGKSSTSALTALILRKAGLRAAAYGNIGRPPLSAALPEEVHPVLEVSSYMMHDLPKADHIHLVTNLYRDHLDWHGGAAPYHAAKLRPFTRPDPAKGFAPRSVIDAHALPASVRAIEDAVRDTGDALHVGDEIIDTGDEMQGFRRGPLRLALTAAAAVATSFLSSKDVAKAAGAAAAEWKGLPSRQQIIPSIDGRTWVDDALSTIPESAIAALQRFASRPVVVLLGGGDRQQDFSPLEAYLAEHGTVRAIGFGPTGRRLRNLTKKVESLQDAITSAEEMCPAGGVILFSPAAPSSPPFKDYRERSALFAERARTA